MDFSQDIRLLIDTVPQPLGLAAGDLGIGARLIGDDARLLGIRTRALGEHAVRLDLIPQSLKMGAQLLRDFTLAFLQPTLFFGGDAQLFRHLPLLLGGLPRTFPVVLLLIHHGALCAAFPISI